MTVLPATLRVHRWYGPVQGRRVCLAAAVQLAAAHHVRADRPPQHQADVADLSEQHPMALFETIEGRIEGGGRAFFFS